ncbi:hypothetical protein C2S51_031633 [Perilla frutescens var. frutescens]|nr:hypothetical protein C2S51_031633 [Perilla frutescens var. frutescens]
MDSLPSLLCGEDGSSLDQHFNFEHDSEYIEILIRKETIFESNFPLKSERNWRRDAVKWILHKGALFGFHFRTAYLSLIYLDRFFSRRTIDEEKLWAIRLLSIACLSLAAKMEECEPPSLSEYEVDEYSFDGGVIQRMELLVLNTLEWKMSCITPFNYLIYFVALFCCGEFRLEELIDRAIELILAIMAEINVMDHRPSVIAAAAVLAAYDHHLTKKTLEIKINDVPSWGSVEKEHTLFCYSLLQEIGMSKSNNIYPDLVFSGDGVDGSMIRSTVGSKRRLAYIDDDHHCPRPKTPKQ